jgi:hypothetical protein
MYRYRRPTWKQWTVGFQGLLSLRGQILGLLDDTACITKVIQRYIQLEDDTGQKNQAGIWIEVVPYWVKDKEGTCYD